MEHYLKERKRERETHENNKLHVGWKKYVKGNAMCFSRHFS